MDFLWIGGIVAAVTAGYQQIRAFFAQLVSLVIVTIDLQEHMAQAMMLYLQMQTRSIHSGGRGYTGRLKNVRSIDRVQLVVWSVLGSTGSLYLEGRCPIWVTRVGATAGPGTFPTPIDFIPNNLRIRFLRGTVDPTQLIRRAADHINELRDGVDTVGSRFFVKYVHGLNRKMAMQIGTLKRDDTSSPTAATNWNEEVNIVALTPINFERGDFLPRQNRAAIDHLALSAEAQTAVAEVRRWKASRQWYADHGLAWRLGWTLYGEPGNGKTALVRAVAQDLDLPVYVYDLATLSNDELQEEWQRMLSSVPCTALIEDIDGVFDLRKTLVGDLTFDCLLNVIDGVDTASGLFLVITTNHIEKIDPAISGQMRDGVATRPGRINRSILMPPPDREGRMLIARRILGESPDPRLKQPWGPFLTTKIVTEQADLAALEASLVDSYAGESGDQFQNRCAALALELYWNQRT